jgi:hypothetical protein
MKGQWDMERQILEENLWLFKGIQQMQALLSTA